MTDAATVGFAEAEGCQQCAAAGLVFRQRLDRDVACPQCQASESDARPGAAGDLSD